MCLTGCERGRKENVLFSVKILGVFVKNLKSHLKSQVFFIVRDQLLGPMTNFRGSCFDGLIRKNMLF